MTRCIQNGKAIKAITQGFKVVDIMWWKIRQKGCKGRMMAIDVSIFAEREFSCSSKMVLYCGVGEDVIENGADENLV